MPSASHSQSGDHRRRVSIRRSAATSSTATSSAADAALQQVLDRRLRTREGRPPAPAARMFGSARTGVAASIERFGWPQWLFRVAVLGFVTFVLGFAVFSSLPGRGGPRRVAVEGTVLFKGRPLAQATLEFHGAGAHGPFSVSVDTNEMGTFRRPAAVGIPFGEYAVLVKSGCIMPNPRAERGTPVRIPPAYASVDATPLRVKVGENESRFEFVVR